MKRLLTSCLNGCSLLVALAMCVAFAIVASSSAIAADRKIGLSENTVEVAQTSERRVALVVGNSSYEGISPLRNPVNDAKDMAAALRKLGFEVTLQLDTSQKNLRRAIINFGGELEEGGVGLFYYAGDGVQEGQANWMIPVDAEIDKPEHISVEAVAVNQVFARMGGARNRLNIVILDACRDNPFASRFRTAATRGLAQMEAPSGTYIAYATAPGAVAADGAGRNSTFTDALLRAIDQPGQRLEDVFKSVRASVQTATNRAQVPWTSSSITGDFYFRPAQAVANGTDNENAKAPEKTEPTEKSAPSSSAANRSEIIIASGPLRGLMLTDWLLLSGDRLKDKEYAALIKEAADLRLQHGAIAEVEAVLQQALSNTFLMLTPITESNARDALNILEKLKPVSGTTAEMLSLEARAYHVLEDFELAESSYVAWLNIAPPEDMKRREMITAMLKARKAEPLSSDESEPELAEQNKESADLSRRIEEQNLVIADLGRRLNLALAAKVEELAEYRSEFFGRLRQVLSGRKGFVIIGDRFVFQSEVLFGSGSAELGSYGKEGLRTFANVLKDVMTRIPKDLPWILQVDGHTDRIPIQTSRFPSNWELSAARAIEVVNYLVTQGIPASRLSATGYGEFQPIDRRDDEIAYRRNRRIELKLTQR